MHWKAIQGATFKIQDGPSGEWHLYFVLSDPANIAGVEPQSVMVVNISTPKPYRRHDETCMLPSGCHPFVTKESFVVFSKACFRSALELEKRVAERTYQEQKPAKINLIKVIVGCMPNAYRLADDLKAYALIVENALEKKYPAVKKSSLIAPAPVPTVVDAPTVPIEVAPAATVAELSTAKPKKVKPWKRAKRN